MTPTTQQIGLLQHTLGINEHRREPYRNYFVAGPGHHAMPDLERLEAASLMTRGYVPAFLPGDSIVFYTTEAGRMLAITSLPAPRKRTRYEEYLRADGCMGDSFGEFLCGGRLPEVESRDHRPYGTWHSSRQYRMFRRHSDGYGVEVHGDWAPTKKEAKASYKAALKEHQQRERESIKVAA